MAGMCVAHPHPHMLCAAPHPSTMVMPKLHHKVCPFSPRHVHFWLLQSGHRSLVGCSHCLGYSHSIHTYLRGGQVPGLEAWTRVSISISLYFCVAWSLWLTGSQETCKPLMLAGRVLASHQPGCAYQTPNGPYLMGAIVDSYSHGMVLHPGCSLRWHMLGCITAHATIWPASIGLPTSSPWWALHKSGAPSD